MASLRYEPKLWLTVAALDPVIEPLFPLYFRLLHVVMWRLSCDIFIMWFPMTRHISFNYSLSILTLYWQGTTPALTLMSFHAFNCISFYLFIYLFIYHVIYHWNSSHSCSNSFQCSPRHLSDMYCMDSHSYAALTILFMFSLRFTSYLLLIYPHIVFYCSYSI